MGKKPYDSKKVAKQIGLRVREIRNSKGWTLEDCEEHGWGNWRYLQEIESGKNITIQTLTNLANLFDVRISDILDSID